MSVLSGISYSLAVPMTTIAKFLSPLGILINASIISLLFMGVRYLWNQFKVSYFEWPLFLKLTYYVMAFIFVLFSLNVLIDLFD